MFGNGYTPSKAVKEYWEGGTIPWFRMEDIRANGRILKDSIQHVTPKAINGAGLFPAGSFILSTTATLGEYALLIADSLANQRFTFLVKNVNRDWQIDNGYFLQYLSVIGDWCRKTANAGGLLAVNMEDLKNFELRLPDISTQRNIAVALASIDTHISALQSLIAKYEAIKKATVNLLLEPKSDWRIVPLGEICEVCSTRRVHESDWTDSGVPFYRARELVALNEGRSITPLHISENLYKELIASSGAIRPGDLLVTGVGSIGVPYLVKRNDKFYFKDGNIIWFKNRGEIWPDYFLHAFRSDNIQKQIIEMACVGTVGSYTITNGKRTLIALPPLDEQKRIVAILDSIDGTINGLKSQLAKAQDIKQGMMSYFFG